MNTIYLYGISGAEGSYRVVRYEWLAAEDFNIQYVKHDALAMQERYPSIKHVYAVSNRRGLGYDFHEAFRKNSIESWAIFKDILEREGWKIF